MRLCFLFLMALILPISTRSSADPIDASNGRTITDNRILLLKLPETIIFHLNNSPTSERLPGANDERLKYIFKHLNNNLSLLSEGKIQFDSMEEGMRLCEDLSLIHKLYLFGSVFKDPSFDRRDAERAMKKALQENSMQYQTELSMILSGQLDCQSYLIKQLTVFAQGLQKTDLTEARIDGIHKMQTGLYYMLSSIFSLITHCQDYTQENKSRITESLQRNIETIFEVFSTKQKADLLIEIDRELKDSSLYFQSEIKKELLKLNSSSCSGLCLIEREHKL